MLLNAFRILSISGQKNMEPSELKNLTLVVEVAHMFIFSI